MSIADKTDTSKVTSKVSRRSELLQSRSFLTDRGLQGLDEYKYKSGEYTFCDNLLNNHVWTPLSNLVPLWMAPNLITLLGTGFIVFAFILQVYYCPDLGENTEPPQWVCGVILLCEILYQTFDAIDGKQARRTGTSSPLGQLFDHGCDSFVVTFVVLMTTTTLGCGVNLTTMLAMFSVQVSFWFSQFGEYHLHIMQHQAAGMGVTEAQIGSMSIQLIGLIAGRAPLMWKLPAINLSAYDILMFIEVAGGFTMTFIQFGRVVFSENRPAWDQLFKQPIGIVTVMIVGIAWSQIPQQRPLLVMLTLGLLGTYLTMWMILCAMTRQELPVFPTILYPLIPLFIISSMRPNGGEQDLLIGAYLTYVGYKLYKFITCTVQEICGHLDINCLTIPPPKQK